ncbi:MAG: TonB-dependent receptor plug domain-containing protein [Opitutaceae bacterium]|nr:TonB-dependent receptor plug domain-containing protein [Opitutaceae bacterium]
MTIPPSPSRVVPRVVLAWSMLVTAQLQAQSGSSIPDAATLAKYDRNKNGRLDPDELRQQQTDEAKAGGVISLTPFEVSTNKDVGYAAGNTLSGGRVDTPLAITPGSISVMTREFMDDFNITNMNDAGSWMIGVDLGTAVPNSNPTSESVYQNIIRGAPSTDNFPTRNGSINFGAADSYNTERFEFQRGPDTAMFGDGGPGGRQGSSSKRATVNRTATTLSLQADTWNGYRHTLDHNQGWGPFAARFNALAQNAPGYQSGMNKLKKAWTLTTTTKLAKNTTFYASYERMNDWNNLWSITNGDAQLAWDGATVNPDNLTALTTAQLNAAGLDFNRAFNGNAAQMYIYNYATRDLQDYGGNNYRTRAAIANLRIPYLGNPHLKAIPSRRPPIPGIDKRFSFAPKDNIARRDQDTLELVVEQRLGDVFLQGKYTRNNFDNNTIWSNTSPNNYLLDVNLRQPNGQINPKYLRPFTDVEQNNLYSQDAIEEYSATGSYRFTKPRWWGYKQLFSLNLSTRETNSENTTRAWRRVDNAANADPYNNANRLFYRVYWDDPRADLAPIFTDPNKSLGVGRWAYVSGVGGAVNGTAGGIVKRTLDHWGLTSQSTFFNDRVGLTGSISFDKVGVDLLSPIAAGLAGTSGAPNFTTILGYNGVPGAHFKRTEQVHSAAVGAVFYPFNFKNEGPLQTILSPIGFVYNFAENTQPPGTGAPNPLIDGNQPPLTHSRTKDFGLRYSVPGGKAYLTVSHYKTDQIDIPSGFGSRNDIQNLWLALGYTDPVRTTSFSYSDPSSRRLEGWEVELTANPTRNITLSANYSHPLVYIVRESEDRKIYVAANTAEWKAGVGDPTTGAGAVAKGPLGLQAGAAGSNGTVQTALNNIQNSLDGLTTGTLQDGSERHRINFNARYRFNEGALKGLGLVAGVQYRGHIKSGSRDARLKFGLPDAATPTATQNAQAAFDYLWTDGYWKNTLTAGANYTRRFGRYNWRLQLNITNLLDVLDPIWGRSGLGNAAYFTVAENALNAGNKRTQFLYSFTNPDPRKFTLTTTVSF